MKVRLTSFSEEWALMFQKEVHILSEIFGDEIIRFEHFGSTSVLGLKAKPVIDMMGIVKDIHKIDSFNEKMDALGYDVVGEYGIDGRRFFRKGGENRTHHIHIYQYDNPQIARHLIFRDYLRAHPEESTKYSCFKENLANQYENTREYSAAKKEFVTEMEQNALQWFAETKRT
ncbi:GrpB family protein [Paenisporosarcina sp.]|uniref:GrpB family protein n=1 Tax=Paenisporosarcina sp. TaxID=1932001 RepID=UPI003C72D55D